MFDADDEAGPPRILEFMDFVVPLILDLCRWVTVAETGSFL